MWWVVDDCGESGGGKMKKDTRMIWFDSRTATVPRQRRQKASRLAYSSMFGYRVGLLVFVNANR